NSFVFEKSSDKSDGRGSNRLAHRLKTCGVDSRTRNNGDVARGDAKGKEGGTIVGIFDQYNGLFTHTEKAQQKQNKKSQQSRIDGLGTEYETKPSKPIYNRNGAAERSERPKYNGLQGDVMSQSGHDVAV